MLLSLLLCLLRGKLNITIRRWKRPSFACQGGRDRVHVGLINGGFSLGRRVPNQKCVCFGVHIISFPPVCLEFWLKRYVVGGL